MAGCYCSALSTDEDDDSSEELERICPASSCGDGTLPNAGLTYIYRKSSFKLKFQFVQDFNIISPRDLDITFKFFIKDNEEDFTYTVSHIQGNLINCLIDDDTQVLVALIGSPNFPEGILCYSYSVMTQDSDFVDSVATTYYSETTSIALVDDLPSVTKSKTTSIVSRELNLDIIQTLV